MEGCLSFKQYTPVKAAKFSIKTSKLCKSFSGCLWSFYVYTGAGSNITTSIHVPDKLQSFKAVVRLVMPLAKLGYTFWMDNYYNSQSLCSLLRDNGIDVSGTLHLNRKHVPQLAKSKKLAKT
jgi:hypothetical protein